MKQLVIMLAAIFIYANNASAQTKVNKTEPQQKLFMDIHYIPGGNVKFEDVAAAHQKDLAVQNRYGVKFIKYWVDEKNGICYCLSSAKDSNSIRATHREAHGLLPSEILEVVAGTETTVYNDNPFFMDIHQLGAGKVTAKEVAAAHEKDLAVQKKYGVNCINYWVNEKNGVVFCLSQASDASKLLDTHRAAHGIMPARIAMVKQGQ